MIYNINSLGELLLIHINSYHSHSCIDRHDPMNFLQKNQAESHHRHPPGSDSDSQSPSWFRRQGHQNRCRWGPQPHVLGVFAVAAVGTGILKSSNIAKWNRFKYVRGRRCNLHIPRGAFLPDLCDKIGKFGLWKQIMSPLSIKQHQFFKIWFLG